MMKQIDFRFLPLVSSHLEVSVGETTPVASTGLEGDPGCLQSEVTEGQPLGTCVWTHRVCQQVVGVLDKEEPLLTWSPLSLQHPVELLARRGGPAVPLLLAAHLHSRPALVHDRHRVLPYALPGGTALQLAAQAEGAARRGGRRWHRDCLPGVKLASSWRGPARPHMFNS